MVTKSRAVELFPERHGFFGCLNPLILNHSTPSLYPAITCFYIVSMADVTRDMILTLIRILPYCGVFVK